MAGSRSLLLSKGLIAFALVVAGYVAVTRSLAAVLAKSDPLSALSVSDDDARVVARAARKVMESAKTDDEREWAVRLARSALVRDATAVPAITTVGIYNGLKDGAGGADWFAYSERLSRRDLRTQLYFIEKSVSNGDVAEALRHYDIALRTSDDSAPTILYPVLRGAIADFAVRREFAKVLARRPLWADAFISDLATKAPDFAVVADFFADVLRRGGQISASSSQALLNNLVAKGEVAVAWKYYLAIHPGGDKLLIRNRNFSAAHVESSPFDWQMVNLAGVSASLGAGDNGQGLEYHLSPTIGSPVASQVTLLPPGKYRFQSILTAASQSVGEGPYWELKCANGLSIGTMEMGGPVSESRTFTRDVIISGNCEAQLLTLIVRPSDDVQGATGLLMLASITRIP